MNYAPALEVRKQHQIPRSAVMDAANYHADAGNRTSVLCESNKCSYQLSRPSRPIFLIHS